MVLKSESGMSVLRHWERVSQKQHRGGVTACTECSATRFKQIGESLYYRQINIEISLTHNPGHRGGEEIAIRDSKIRIIHERMGCGRMRTVNPLVVITR